MLGLFVVGTIVPLHGAIYGVLSQASLAEVYLYRDQQFSSRKLAGHVSGGIDIKALKTTFDTKMPLVSIKGNGVFFFKSTVPLPLTISVKEPTVQFYSLEEKMGNVVLLELIKGRTKTYAFKKKLLLGKKQENFFLVISPEGSVSLVKNSELKVASAAKANVLLQTLPASSKAIFFSQHLDVFKKWAKTQKASIVEAVIAAGQKLDSKYSASLHKAYKKS